MKNIFHFVLKSTSILLLILFSLSASSQIQINSHVLPPYLNRIVDYASRPELMVVTLTNTLPREANIQLTARLTGDNGMSAWVKPGYRSPRSIIIGGGQTITLNGNDIAQLFNINNIEYTGVSREDMVRGLGLKEGNYQLCIQALNYNTLSPMSAEQMGCANIRIADIEPPRILMPLNEQVVNSRGTQAVSFTWSTPSSTSPGIQYKVKLVENLLNRNPNDAIQTTRPLFEETVSGNMLLYGPSHPALVKGRKYTMLVQAIDVSGRTNFRNSGKSEVISFVYGNDENESLAGIIDQPMSVKSASMNFRPECSCKVNLPNDNGIVATSIKVGDVVKVNYHEMHISSIQSLGDGYFSGAGTIVLPGLAQTSKLIKLRVEFVNIKINKYGSVNQVTKGQVYGRVKNDFGFLPQVNNPDIKAIPMNSDQVNQLDQYFKNNAQQLLSSVQNMGNTVGFELPLGIDKGSFTIGVTNVVFDAEQTWFDAVTVLNMADAFEKVALSGRGICMNENSFCGEAELYLSDNFKAGSTGLTLLGGTDDQVTKIKFDKSGFKELIINANYAFPSFSNLRDLQGQLLVGKLTAKTDKSWADWIGELSLPAFKIGDFSDIQFGTSNTNTIVYFDHSDTRSIDGMPIKFESGDVSDAPIHISNNWTGIYIPKIAISLPGPIKNVSGNNLSVQAEKLIFHEGITGNVSVKNILSLGDGSLDGWYVSIDNISLNFWKNSFKESRMEGKLVLPASGEGFNKVQNQIDYTCTMTKPAGEQFSFQMVAKPKSELEFSALWTTLNIADNSNVLVLSDKNDSFFAEATLFGSMKFKTDIKHLPDLTLGTIDFQNMKIRSKGPYFEPGQMNFTAGGNNLVKLNEYPEELYSYVSPKGPSAGLLVSDENFSQNGGGGSVIGFSITETSVSPYIDKKNIGFQFEGSLQLVKGVTFIPKASFKFAVYGDIGDVVNNRQVWKSVRGKLEYVSLSAEAMLGPVQVSGKLYYQDITDGGVTDRGLGARLSARLPATSAGISMQALFGSRSTSSKKFNYFYMDASLDLPTPGIPMFPGTAIYGFAGGFYYNMTAITPKSDGNLKTPSMGVEDPPSDIPKSVQITSFSGTTYKPQGADVEGANFGIQAGVYFGLASRNTLEGLLSLAIEMNSSHGFKSFALKGDAGVMTGSEMTFKERQSNALAQASLGLEIKMTNNAFESLKTEGKYSISYPKGETALISASENSLEFYIDKNSWYFKMGTPKKPNELTILKFLTSKGYFQIGNNIDPINGVPEEILKIMGVANANSSSEENSKFSNSKTPELQSFTNKNQLANGSGVNFGAMLEVKANPKYAIFYMDLYGGMGFDFQLMQLQKDNPNCTQKAGSWYASGQAYMGVQAGCGVNINLFGFKKNIEFIRAGLGASLEAGAPTPTYARGMVGGSFSILDGLISGPFNFKLQIGDVCEQTADRELKLISDIKPIGNDISILNRPSVAFNYPLNRDFVVPINDKDKVKYEVYRFRPSYVSIDVKKNGSMVYTSKDFSEAGDQGLYTDQQKRYYSVYMLTLNNNANVLDPLSNYTMNVNAKIKILKSSLLESWSKNQANQALGVNNEEFKFEYVKKNDGSGEYADHANANFKTDNGPNNISLELVQDIMPIHRHNNLPYQVVPNRAYLKLSRKLSIPNSFNTNIVNPKAVARIVSMNAASETQIQDLPITIDGDGFTWSFARPTLLPNQKYVIRFLLKGNLPASNDKKENTKLVTKETFGDQGETKLNNRDIMMNSLAMGANEQELFSWYFNTGSFKNYTEKLNKLTLDKLYVNEKLVDVNTPSLNLANFASETNTVMAFTVKYHFYGPEYFNQLDYGDWKIGDIFPKIGNTNTNIKLNNRKYLTYISDIPPRIPEFDRIVEDFMKKAFDGQMTLNIGQITMPWNHITGGIEVRESSSFINPSKILPHGLYSIDYGDHNYGIDPPIEEEILEQEQAEQKSLTRIFSNSSILSSSINAKLTGTNNLLTGANNMSQVIPKKHVYSTNFTTQTTSGRGALNGANMVLERINSVKNLGYPTDMVSNLGVMIDKISTLSTNTGGFAPSNVGKQNVPAVTVK